MDVAIAGLSLSYLLLAGLGRIKRPFLSQSKDNHAISRPAFGLIQHSSPQNPRVDVVLVHGIGKIQGASWEFAGLDASNPTHLHKSLQESARIFLYCYDSDLRTPEHLAARTLLGEASHLVSLLVQTRKEQGCQDRPIIFVAHGLGGLLLKNALIYAYKSRNQSERRIYDCTRGIYFVAVPQATCPARLADELWSHVHPLLAERPKPGALDVWKEPRFKKSMSSLCFSLSRFEPLARHREKNNIRIHNEESYLSPDALEKIISSYLSNNQQEKFIITTPEPQSIEQYGFSVGTNSRNNPWVFHPWEEEKERCLPNPSSQPLVVHRNGKPQNLLPEHNSAAIKQYDSVFLIQATSKKSLDESFVNIFRHLQEYYKNKTGSAETAAKLIGLDLPSLDDEQILLNDVMTASVIEVVKGWLAHPSNTSWFLVLEDVGGSSAYLSEDQAAKTLEELGGVVRPISDFLGESRHMVCALPEGETIHDKLTFWGPHWVGSQPREGHLPEQPDFFLICQNPDINSLEDLHSKILSICLVISFNKSRKPRGDLSDRTLISDRTLLEFSLLPSFGESSTALRDAITFLKDGQFLLPIGRSSSDLLVVNDYLVENQRDILAIIGPRSNMPTPKLAETAWGCLGQSLNDYKPLEGLDLGALLVGNCSATAQWCSTSKLELVQFDTNWTDLGRLCERHSNYETAAELYEAGRKRQCEIYPGPNMYPAYFKDSIRVCHTYMLAGSQRAEEEIQKLWDKVEKTNTVSQSSKCELLVLKADLASSKGNTHEVVSILSDILSMDTLSPTEERLDYTVISTMKKLSSYLKICRHDDSASFLLERCLLSCENQRSINRPTTLSLLKSLADMSFEQGELRRAEDYYTHAQNLAEQWLGRHHPEVAICQAMCGVTAGLRGHHREAMEIFHEAVQLARQTFPDNHRFVVRLHLRWALSMAVQGRYAEAKTNLNSILEALDQTINVVDPELLHQTLTILNKYFWMKKDRIELEAIWNHVLESDAFSSSSWTKLPLESADGWILVNPSSMDNSCSDTTAYSCVLDGGE